MELQCFPLTSCSGNKMHKITLLGLGPSSFLFWCPILHMGDSSYCVHHIDFFTFLYLRTHFLPSLFNLQLALCQTPPAGPLLILQRLEGHQFQVQSQLSCQWMTRIQDLFGNIGANKQPVRHSVCKRSLSTEDDRFALAIRKRAGRGMPCQYLFPKCPNEWTNAAFSKEHGWS